MIFVDYREGSKHFAPLLIKAGIEAEITTLDFGDLFFIGRGEGGEPLDIGIEFKKLPDFIGSIRSERLQGHQLPGMRAADEGEKPLYDFAYLLIEGDLVYDARGMLMRRSGRQSFKPFGGKMTIHEVFKRVNTLHMVGGLNPMFTRTQRDSVKWIEATYRSWTDVDLDKHKSHIGVHNPKPLRRMTKFQMAFVNPAFPGVGIEVAKAAEKKFNGSIRKAITASADAWATLSINGRQFGMAHAKKLVEAMK